MKIKKNSIWLSILMLSSSCIFAHPELYRSTILMECDDEPSQEEVIGATNQLFEMYLLQLSHLAGVLSPEELQPLLLQHLAEISRIIEEKPAYPAAVFYPQEEAL